MESQGGGAAVWWGLTKRLGLTDSKTLESFGRRAAWSDTSAVVWEQTGCAGGKQAGEPSEEVATATRARADEC